MRVDARTIDRDRELETDLCIIGGGAAGITLAREFIGKPARVLLLESGDVEFDAATQALAGGELAGLPYFGLDAARLRWLGGTTNHWGGTCRPMDPEDFETKPWIPHSGWPISLRDVEPYYERASALCGLRSDDWDPAVWARRDRYPAIGFDDTRVINRVSQIVARESRSFRIAYQGELDAAANVTVHCRANVTEVETNETGSLAARVRVATLEGNRYTVRARRFVLAAGGIENARVLLLSNRRWSGGVGNAHDVVGRFFLEHPRFVGGLLLPANPTMNLGFYDQHKVGNHRLLAYWTIAREALESERMTDVHMNLRPVFHGAFKNAMISQDLAALRKLVARGKAGGDLDELGRHLARVMTDLATWGSVAIPGAPLPVPFPEIVRDLMTHTPAQAQAHIPDLAGDIVARALTEVVGAPIESVRLRTRIDAAPNPDSRVTLAEERDALGLRRTRLDWRLSPIDHYSARRALEILGAEAGRTGLGRVRVLLSEDTSVWPQDLAGGWHHMGTTRMSDDPKRGVVDRELRVHGMGNLYVAGSSVFPTAGSGTPTLTLVALTLRLAERLQKELS